MTTRTRPRLRRITGALLLALLILSASPALAQVPQTLTHQGRLLEGGMGIEGDHVIEFAISSPDKETTIHIEKVTVSFSNGYYTVRLGEESPLPDGLFDDGSLEVELTIDPDGQNTTLSPPQKITAVPYAFVSESVRGGEVIASEIMVKTTDGPIDVIDGEGNWVGKPIKGNKVGENAITHNHLDNEAVGSNELRNRAVSAEKIALGAVGTDHVAPNAIGGGHIIDGGVSGADLQDNSVSGTDIQDGTLTNADVQPMGGLYSRKSELYEQVIPFNIGAGASGTSRAACADANDLPLSGNCFSSSGAELRSTRAIDWSAEANPAAQECTFFNPQDGTISSEARIICISVP